MEAECIEEYVLLDLYNILTLFMILVIVFVEVEIDRTGFFALNDF